MGDLKAFSKSQSNIVIVVCKTNPVSIQTCKTSSISHEFSLLDVVIQQQLDSVDTHWHRLLQISYRGFQTHFTVENKHLLFIGWEFSTVVLDQISLREMRVRHAYRLTCGPSLAIYVTWYVVLAFLEAIVVLVFSTVSVKFLLCQNLNCCNI